MQDQKPLIDFEFGLSQLGGNAELLNKMLGKFKQQFEQVPELLAQHIRDDDFDSAKMRIHTAKGITGNLGLRALFECCKVFDAELKQNQADPKTVQAFTQLMQDTCAAIDGRDVSHHAAAPAKTNYVENAKSELQHLLSRHEFIDDALLRDLVSSIGMDEDKAKTITELIEQLQYDKAIMLLNE